VSAAIDATPYAHTIKVDRPRSTWQCRSSSKWLWCRNSRKVIQLVDHAEEDALLEQFRRRNLMPQIEIERS